jgi:transcriptional regulator with XRE-family HTH domain
MRSEAFGTKAATNGSGTPLPPCRAEEVIQLRLKAHMTQAELAKKAHTSQPAISRLESGSYTNVSMAFLRKVGAVLGATPVVHFKAS